jgi:lambda family phage minor tail protein L
MSGSVYHFSPQCYSDGSLLTWGGQTYDLLPIGIDGLEAKASMSELPQASLTVSNVGGSLLSAVVALGDLIGSKLTHWKTKVSYLDGQANPDTTQFVGPYVWYLTQKTSHTNLAIQWSLSMMLDRPGFMFPIRQVVRYPGINPPDGIYFPGVSPYRTSQSQSQ